MACIAVEQWEPIGYNPGISVGKWVELLNDPQIFNDASLQVMKRMKDCHGVASCAQLALKYGKTSAFYNEVSSHLGNRVFQKTNIAPCSQKHMKYVSALYLQRTANKGELGSFVWKLHDELSQALDLVDLSGVPLYADFPQDEKRIFSSAKIDVSDLERAARHYATYHPVSQEATVRQYHRSESVKRYAKALANGRCQLCNMEAPFADANGEPYLEIHHIIWLSDGGADTIENTVALCPNCHRRMHVLQSPKDVEQLLQSASKRSV